MTSLARSPGTDVEAMWSLPRATRSRRCPQSLSELLKVNDLLWPPVTDNRLLLELTVGVLLRPANDPATTAPSRQDLGHSDVVSHPSANTAGDGLEGEEGTFLLCTFWLAQALAQAGQPVRARAVFERAAAFVNEVGLLAEEVDPLSAELLGNFPQAFSHIGLVNAAWAISQSERQAQAT
jgi:Glycosyl hydrolases family 15